MPGRAIVLLASYAPAYLRIWEHLVRRELDEGRKPLVLDITSISPVPVDSYHRGVLRIFGLDYIGHDVRERIGALGAEYRTIGEYQQPGDDLPLDAAGEELVDISVQSAMISYFRTDRPDRSKSRVVRTSRAFSREGRITFRVVERLFAPPSDFDLLYVPNGRAPNQKMAAVAARKASAAVLHIEKGESANGAYLQGYAPQDRIASQESVKVVLAGHSPSEIRAVADAWLSRRVPSKESRNEFAELWTEDADLGFPPDARIAGFFTSSQDEYQFLGPDWQLHDWDDQFQAFGALLDEFEKEGYSCYLRVHPNLATKAHECFAREREGIRALARAHPQLRVIWHDDPANSYLLLERTDAVVVWDSTVGIEASAMGIPVFTAATSRYGITADVREVLSAGDLATLGVQTWEVDADKAKEFIAYIYLRDEQMPPEVVSWNPPWVTSKPIRAKIAAAFVSGSAPYVRDAFASIFDVYRHRSLKANLSRFRRG